MGYPSYTRMYFCMHVDNMTTAAFFISSLAGFLYAKRNGLYYQGFAVALGSIFVFDYMHRRDLDRTTPYSEISS